MSKFNRGLWQVKSLDSVFSWQPGKEVWREEETRLMKMKMKIMEMKLKIMEIKMAMVINMVIRTRKSM